MLRFLLLRAVIFAAALSATMLVSPAPWAGPQGPACVSLEAFIIHEVEPLRRAGVPILVLADAYEVARYLAVIGGDLPPDTLKADALVIGTDHASAVIAVVADMQMCTVLHVDINLHQKAMLTAKRGA